MNGVSLRTSLLCLGLATAAVGACSAESSTPPGGTGGRTTNNTGGTLSTGGTTPVGTGGTTPVGTGGTPGAAGTVSAAGTVGVAGTVSAAGTTSTGGTGANPTTCPAPPAAGALADLAIDDLEDADNGINKIGGRSGYWFTFLDTNGSTIVPAPDPSGLNPLMPGTTDCHGGAACVIVSGSTMPAAAPVFPYAGVGFDFSNAMKSCPYNVTAYTGVKFWARGDAAVRVKVTSMATTASVDGGACATNCSDAHGQALILTPTWAEVTVPFGTIAQEGWGTVAAFDKTTVLGLQIQFPSGAAFNAAFDDFTFY